MKNNLDIFHNKYSSPTSATAVSWYLLGLYNDNLMACVKVKLMKIWRTSHSAIPAVAHSYTSPSAADGNYHLCVPTNLGCQ